MDYCMLPKNINSVSLLAISVVLLGSAFITPSWGINNEDEDGHPGTSHNSSSSPFDKLPTESVVNVFRFLPQGSYKAVSNVNQLFRAVATDGKGHFKKSIIFKEAYKAQQDLLLSQASNISSFSQTLVNLRKILSDKSPEEQAQLASELSEELQTKASESKNFTDRSHDLRAIWASLALLRACDKDWSADIREWFENTALPSLERTYPEQEALILLAHTSSVLNEFNALGVAGTHENKRYTLAVELCERDQESTVTVFNAGHTYEDSKTKSNYYTLALAKNPDLSLEDFESAAETFTKLKEWALAGKCYTLAFNKDPDSLIGHIFNAATSFSNAQDWPSAGKCYSLFFEKNPDLPPELSLNAHLGAATAYYRLKDYELAAKYFTLAIKMDPKLSAKYCLLAAFSYSALEKWDLEAEYCLRAFQKDPHLDPSYFVCISRAYSKSHNLSLAAKFYKLALEKNAKLEISDKYDAATINAHLKDWPAATMWYASILEMPHPDLPREVYLGAADAYFYSMEWNLALNHYSHALENFPNLPSTIYLNAGYAATKEGQSERASVYFEKFINSTDANNFDRKLLPETLKIIEDTLTVAKSTVSFREWIRTIRSKGLDGMDT